jgi:excisionase family DNA binding protein
MSFMSTTIELLSVEQVATELGKTPVWIRKLCQGGKIQASKVGRDWVITRKTLDKLLREQSEKS